MELMAKHPQEDVDEKGQHFLSGLQEIGLKLRGRVSTDMKVKFASRLMRLPKNMSQRQDKGTKDRAL